MRFLTRADIADFALEIAFVAIPVAGLAVLVACTPGAPGTSAANMATGALVTAVTDAQLGLACYSDVHSMKNPTIAGVLSITNDPNCVAALNAVLAGATGGTTAPGVNGQTLIVTAPGGVAGVSPPPVPPAAAH